MLHCPRISTRRFARMMLSVGALLGASVAPGLAADPTGDWQVEGGVANMRVAECNGSMWGVVAWEKKPGGRDIKNPDPAKQNRPTLGMVSLFDMKKKPGVDVWEGEVYDSQTTGRRWSATLTSKGNDELRLEGCALGFMCSGQTWTRVAPPIPLSPTNAAKGAAKSTKGGNGLPQPGAPAKQTAATPKAAPAGRKPAAPGQPADIGDICLLPEIVNYAPAR
jgi:uncharacterized protein (DUF2147 family)